MTIPFAWGTHETVVRAILVDGGIECLHEPVYHGNPVDENGSLVFTDFGWDVLDLLKASGFQDAWVDVYHDPKNGLLGGGLQVFEAVR